MPKLLSVSEVRRALYWAAGGPATAGPGQPSEALLGTLFHKLFAGLTGPDTAGNLVRPLEGADPKIDAWKVALRRHAYVWHVGPALVEHERDLQGLGPKLLGFWQAAQELTDWLAEAMWEQQAAGRNVADARAAVFEAHEQEVSRELREPGWTDSVVIEGRIDAVLRQPSSGTACLVELKTGRSAPEADLCQAALYHLLHGGDTRSQVAVIGFLPRRHEARFSAKQLTEAQVALKLLAARLAGVLPVKEVARPRVPPRPIVAPRTRRAGGAREPGQTELRDKLIAAYAEFGVTLRIVDEPLVGPTFVRFFVEPGRAVQLGHVERLAPSVWTRLRTDQPPLVSVDRGRIAIDVQRPDRQDVLWSTIRDQLPKAGPGGASSFPVGIAVDGTVRWADFSRPEHSHFLVAGTAGSGKSEWLRAMLASLLASNGPSTLKLALIDPKRVGFGAFEGCGCLWRPMAYSPEEALHLIDALVEEMEDRYRRLAKAGGVQDVKALAEQRGEVLARIVCACDEYADLLAEKGTRREIESRVARLAQKGRAAGIHLVFATQRPSRDVVTGVINANLMARVALKVAAPLESRLIVDSGGAAALLGRGDLLFRDLGDPVRLQSPYVKDDELRHILKSFAPPQD